MVIAGLVPTASAQVRDAGLLISQAELNLHAERLDLAPYQREAAEVMYRTYAAQFNDAREAHRALQMWLWTNTSATNWYGGESFKPFYERVMRQERELEIAWQRGARDLERHYFERLNRIAPSADEAIATFERQHRRERMLASHKTSLPAGAACDLVRLIVTEKFDVRENPALKQVIAEYERSLDELLRRFDEHFISSQLARHEAGSALQNARDEQDVDRIMQCASALADVITQGSGIAFELWVLQQKTADRLVKALAGHNKDRLQDLLAVQVNAFAHPERKSPLEIVFERVGHVQSLSAEAIVELNQLRSRYAALRSSRIPVLRALYSKTIEPVELGEGFRLGFIGNHDQAREHWARLQTPWETEKKQWLVECDAIRDQIERLERQSEHEQ